MVGRLTSWERSEVVNEAMCAGLNGWPPIFFAGYLYQTSGSERPVSEGIVTIVQSAGRCPHLDFMNTAICWWLVRAAES